MCPQVLQKELQDGDVQLTALETLVSSDQSGRTQYEKLCADWTELQRRVTVRPPSISQAAVCGFLCPEFSLQQDKIRSDYLLLYFL